MNDNELTSYLNGGINRLISSILKNTLGSPRETAFLINYLKAYKISENKRDLWEQNGLHVPPFLIASITDSCNLTCGGCYARASGMCRDSSPGNTLTSYQWKNIFSQAEDMGISFILLAGGEPLIRKDIIVEASTFKNIIFPIFTNGTLIDMSYINLFSRHRNLIPILSAEGGEMLTDQRRGAGTYSIIIKNMEKLYDKNILFGVSVTVTTENLKEVSSPVFIDQMKSLGCKIVLFIEYVPMDKSTEYLAFTEENRDSLEVCQSELRKIYQDILFISFPGDEKYSGGCLAAGRGFFHISPRGNAEACPFSPYSDCDLLTSSLEEVLKSDFFRRLREDDLHKQEHTGGCTLFHNRDIVKDILAKKSF